MSRFRPFDLAPPVDVLVVGSGVAGLAVALACGERCRVRVLTKSRFGVGGSSPWAQGGIAVALAEGDAPAEHARDTLTVSGGIGAADAVEVLTSEGVEAVRSLIDLGARFDLGPDGALHYGREAAHSHHRILHAGGDATGLEIVRALVEATRALDNLEVVEEAWAEELWVEAGRVRGLLARQNGELVVHRAAAVVLATGGIGQVYLHTTNPPECTGDGLAMAARAGARLADLEFVQFHPTALACDRDPLPLLTEAIRGAGGILVDESGYRFMLEEDSRAELAPRDVVARAIWRRRAAGHEVFLDASGSTGMRFPARFPTVWERCREQGIDPRREGMPVTPAVHYHMGGVATDLAGRTSLAGLWACGETASTGVHGANRLASNSLLEGLVFGRRVGQDVVANLGAPALSAPSETTIEALVRSSQEPAGLRRAVRETMWRQVALVRNGPGLEQALDALLGWREAHPNLGGEVGNLLTVAELVTPAPLRRPESRGAHHREDHPVPDPAWRHRSLYTADELAGWLPTWSVAGSHG